jgi:hypothetical protein
MNANAAAIEASDREARKEGAWRLWHEEQKRDREISASRSSGQAESADWSVAAM